MLVLITATVVLIQINGRHGWSARWPL